MAWPNLIYGSGPGEWDTIPELLQSAANYDFVNGQKMTINGTVCGNVANASSVDGNGNYSNTGSVGGVEWVGPTGPIHSTYTSQSFDCQWYTINSGFPPGCNADPKNEPSDQLFVDIAIASNTAKALTPTQTYAGIDTNSGDVTINVVSGLNVINIPPNPYGTTEGKLEVRGNGNLIIDGPADSVVIFNVGADNQVNAVRNGMSILNGRSILTTGGVLADNILFNIIGGDITINAGVVNGNILVRAGSDVKGKADIQGFSNINGRVLGDGNHSSEFSLATDALICRLTPSIDVEKYISIDNGFSWLDADTSPGPLIPSNITPQFKYVVTNNGNVTLNNVSVVDDNYGLIGQLPSLAPNASFEWIIVRQWEEGQHVNIATATGEYNGVTYTDTDTVYYFGIQPAIEIIKYVSADNGITWIDANNPTGPIIPSGVSPQFKYVVTNIGNVTLTNINVNDNVYGLIGQLASLDPNASFEWIYIGTWQLGQNTNIATVSANYNTDTLTDTDVANYFGTDEATPSLDLIKYVSDDGVTWYDANSSPGPIYVNGTNVQFKFEVINTGNVTLTNIQVTDDNFGLIGNLASLLPGASFEWIIIVPWQQGQHMNVGTAVANYNGSTIEDTDPAHYFGAAPSIDIEKFISIDNGNTWLDADIAPGPMILSNITPQFKFTITNTGNVTLSNIIVVDDKYGFIGNLVSLAPLATFDWIIVKPWTPGQHVNTATVNGTYNGITYTDTDPAHYFGLNPQIDIEKYVSADNGNTWLDEDDAPGVTIPSSITPQFKFVVTNVGNVTLTNITVSDNVFGLIGTLPSLNPGDSFEWIIIVPWQQGQHVNTATATGEYGDNTYTDTDTTYYNGANPGLEIIKYVSVDEGITWIDANTPPGPHLPNGITPKFKYVVTNTGDVTIINITVTDSVLGLIGSLPSLNPGESFEWVV